MPSAQARYWLLTVPHHHFAPWLPPRVTYLRGQLERGADTGYLHWQLLAVFERQVRLAAVKSVFGDAVHAEASRSSAADEYVWKDDTAVAGTRFELGAKPVQRGQKRDWAATWTAARSGKRYFILILSFPSPASGGQQGG